MNINKLSNTQINTNKGKTNQLKCKCNLSNEYIYYKGICLNIKNNNTKYIKDSYLQHKVFDGLSLSDSFKIDLLTLVYLGCKLVNNNDIELTSYNFKNNQKASYIITLKNDLIIYIYGSDASVKKHFNILKKYKTSIKHIEFYTLVKHNYTSYAIATDFMVYYPPYSKKLFEYNNGIGYNPNTKNTTIKIW
ncbi:MAG: hypothetical protein J6J36_06875 [Clostridia bacterium]|nr:hypothetical protein [Clostridia bacterium]